MTDAQQEQARSPAPPAPRLAGNLHDGDRMRLRSILAIVLIVFGLAALALGRITYTTHRKVLDIGPVQATAEERHSIPLPPVVGIVAVGAGVILLVTGRRERT